jgi:hypothetical protein
MVAKQSGRGCGVKSACRRALMHFVAAGTVLSLTACASTWHNPNKGPQEAAADQQVCAAEAEETALTRAARQKVDYGSTSPVMPGLNRGETPMQLQERSQIESTYTRDFESCMRSKGYAQDKPAS